MSAGFVSGLAARGWRIVRLYGMAAPGTCSCSKGRDCPNPGKHPVGDDWQSRATTDPDQVVEWAERYPDCNYGLLLGPLSGVIDVELDGDDAKAAWQSLGLGEIWTPTYSAGRGPHRLFKWTEDLPPATVKKPLGIEVRIGQGGRALQSVIPPSMHHSGVRYAWVEGLSPEDVELQPLPEKLFNLLWNDDGHEAEAGTRRTPARAIIHQPVQEGSRNDELYRFAVAEGFRCLDIENPQEQSDLLGKVRAINQMQCRPPLSDREVVTIYQSAVAYVRKSDAAGVPVVEAIATAGGRDAGEGSGGKKKTSIKGGREWIQSLVATGLSYAPPRGGGDPEWGPGEWRLTVVHSDPLEYRLNVPAWKVYTPSGTGNVSLTVDQYRSSTKVAAAVLSATGMVMLDDEPGKWKRIWDGGFKVKDSSGRTRTTKGVKSKLLAAAEEEWPGASSLRYVVLAGWLYDRLSQASQPSDDDTPDPTGRACWRTDGTLWFTWSRVWEDIERNHKVVEGERLSLKRRLLAETGSADWQHAEFRHAGGTRKTYVVWNREEYAALERLAAEKTGSL